ncbi:MAG TPA: acyltransferase [Methanospirillum sp.]|jgi:acetyltransferase-like isoleucine patch superfamily enzyme|uniref:acyltransferase n=1 Tax=Methanospirillum sp. TaxID=45200 RepID=UPI001BD4E8FF|nr:acyltransferase [Methanospirillum sp.]HPY61452.1 acyltransferase [Methanospirillum sp.]
MIEYGVNRIGKNVQFFEPVTLGFPSRDYIGKKEHPGVIIGDNAIIRSGTILYADVRAGDGFSTGHNVLVREKTTIGSNVSIGTGVIIEGHCTIGDHVSLQSMVYIPTNSELGNHVFIGPNAVLTNDKYPPHGGKNLTGPTIHDHASIGANSTILPGVKVGEGALVAAGSIVTKDVPPFSLAIGSPARIKPLPDGAVPK